MHIHFLHCFDAAYYTFYAFYHFASQLVCLLTDGVFFYRFTTTMYTEFAFVTTTNTVTDSETTSGGENLLTGTVYRTFRAFCFHLKEYGKCALDLCCYQKIPF